MVVFRWKWTGTSLHQGFWLVSFRTVSLKLSWTVGRRGFQGESAKNRDEGGWQCIFGSESGEYVTGKPNQGSFSLFLLSLVFTNHISLNSLFFLRSLSLSLYHSVSFLNRSILFYFLLFFWFFNLGVYYVRWWVCMAWGVFALLFLFFFNVRWWWSVNSEILCSVCVESLMGSFLLFYFFPPPIIWMMMIYGEYMLVWFLSKKVSRFY